MPLIEPPWAAARVFEYYTVGSANAAIPEVTKRYELTMRRRAEVMRAEQSLQAALASDSGLDVYSERKQALNSALTAFYSAIEGIESLGVAVKGLDEGLIDFPSRRFDADVWLCWKYGEKEIKFWHEKDSGFGKRKPIAVSDESLV